MPELIRLNIPFIVILLAGAGAFGISYFFYRKTNPQISEFARWILLILRALVIWLLVLLFFTPTIRLTLLREKLQKIAVFIDNSKSMTVKENGNTRWDQVVKIVKTIQNELPQNAISWFSFNAQVEPLTSLDSLRTSEGPTNFQAVINKIGKEKFDRVIIISDGIITEGRLPMLEQRTSSKIFTIPVGKMQSPVDLFISDVQAPNTIYQNEMTEVKVVVGAQNLQKNISLKLKIKDKNKLLGQQTIKLVKGGGEFSVTFKYRLANQGLHHLTAELQALEEESNVENNQFHFVQEVLKARKLVALFSAYPNFDVKFLKLAIKKFPRFNALTFVENNRGQFLIKDDLNKLDSTDVWLFVDFPGLKTSSQVLQRLRTSWEKNHQNVFLMLGPRFNATKLQQISTKFLRITRTGNRMAKELMPVVNTLPQAAAFVKIFDDQVVNQQFWSLAPPLQTYYLNLPAANDNLMLVQSSVKGRMVPLLFLSEKQLKTIVLNGMGFWRWHFLLQPNERLDQGYTILVEKLLSWLGQRTPFKPVALFVDKKSANIGQPVKIEVRVLDTRLQTVENSSVIINIKKGQQSFSLPIQKEKAGLFKTQFTPVRAGDFKLLAQAFQNGQLWGVDSTQIMVIPVNKELIHLNPDTLFLKKLAEFNQGEMIPLDSLYHLTDIFRGQKQYFHQEKEIEIWYKVGLLILILILITLEWSLRKKWNLI
ncbi:MAG: VWA domain-containing protein [Caldisericaceae bacterium]|nr:VWA domain-containing protein [Caldisericaceae bacterium]